VQPSQVFRIHLTQSHVDFVACGDQCSGDSDGLASGFREIMQSGGVIIDCIRISAGLHLDDRRHSHRRDLW
jgi:hypothetical protein